MISATLSIAWPFRTITSQTVHLILQILMKYFCFMLRTGYTNVTGHSMFFISHMDLILFWAKHRPFCENTAAAFIKRTLIRNQKLIFLNF